MESRMVCLDGKSTRASLALEGQVTRHTSVKWTTVFEIVSSEMQIYSWQIYSLLFPPPRLGVAHTVFTSGQNMFILKTNYACLTMKVGQIMIEFTVPQQTRLKF